jgi:hypothetical protein
MGFEQTLCLAIRQRKLVNIRYSGETGWSSVEPYMVA